VALRRVRPGDEWGAVAVEFALVLPIFLLLIFGAIQYGWYFYQAQEGAFATREGARAGAVGSVDSTQLAQLVNDRIASTNAVVTTTCYLDTPGPGNGRYSIGDTLRVTSVFTAVDFGFPFLPYPRGGQVQQVAETRIEDTTPQKAASDVETCR